MRLIKVVDLCERLGIPRRTVNDWIQKDPTIAVWVPAKPRARRGVYTGEHWIRLDRLAGRPGIDSVDALLLGEARWMKAVDLAAMSGIPRRTLSYWCRTRAGFGKRIGRNWYVDLEQFGAQSTEVESLFLSNLGKTKPQQE